MKIVSIVGARPQFIKAAIVSRKLRNKGIKEILIHTGQHYDYRMSEIFFKELRLKEPDYYLGIGSATQGEQTGRMLIKIEKCLVKEKPDWVVVYGDTNSTLAGAIVSSKLHIPLAHVEAGLRSYNKKMPEEINRILTDHCSDMLFAPTDTAVKNLEKEGITQGVYKVGDVMFDVALDVRSKVKEEEVLKKFDLKSKEFILVTIHRAENTDVKKNLENIWNALKEIANYGIKLFFPIHPRTKKALENYGLLNEKKPQNLIINPPVSYLDMICLECNARVIITDSGGVQKEGYFFKIPCIVPRNETEWIELVERGFNVLTGTAKEKIVKAVFEKWEHKGTERWVDFYGNGQASDRIVNLLLK